MLNSGNKDYRLGVDEVSKSAWSNKNKYYMSGVNQNPYGDKRVLNSTNKGCRLGECKFNKA